MGSDQLLLLQDWIDEKFLHAFYIQERIAPNDQTCLMLCLLDRQQGIGVAEMLPPSFTELHVDYQPPADTWNLRLFFRTDRTLADELRVAVLQMFLHSLFREKGAHGVVWEIHQSEGLLLELASSAGFHPIHTARDYILYHARAASPLTSAS